MSAITEKWPAIQAKLLKNADKLFVGGMAGVVGVLGYFYLNENSTPDREPSPIETRELDVKIKKGDPVVSQVEMMFLFREEFEKTPFARLGELNMFDAKEIRDPDKLLQDAKQKVSEARKLLQEQKPEAALNAVNEALKLQKDFPPALELRAELEALLKPAAPTGQPAGGS